MNTLSQSEIDYIFRSPEGLRCLADFWDYQATLFGGMDDPEGERRATEKAEEFKLLADQAQVAIDNGD